MKCFHHNDNDGRLSAFLVIQKFTQAVAIEVNYGKPFPLSQINKDEPIWIVDYNPQPDEMLKILERTKNVVWIDHHKSGIELFKDFPHKIEGIRDSSKAACELTYHYVYPLLKKCLFHFIELVGDRDTWTFKFGDESKYFHLGSLLYDTSPNGGFWSGLWGETIEVEDIIEKGKLVEAFRDNQGADLCKSWAFEYGFQGYNCLAMVTGLKGSEVFGKNIDKYDICIAMAYNGEKWVNSLYSKTIDVGEIAKRLGGGGHFGAAGFQTSKFITELF